MIHPAAETEFRQLTGLCRKYHLTTLDWLPEVGLTLMIISTSQPLSKQDIQLIRQAVKFSPDIRIILSKTDLLSQSETGQMIRYLRSELKKEFDRDFRIYPYSVSDPVYRDQLISYLQLALFKRVFIRYFVKQIPFEVEKNMHRMTSELTALFTSVIHEMEKNTLQDISSELDTIKQLLTKRKDHLQTIQVSLDALKQTSVD